MPGRAEFRWSLTSTAFAALRDGLTISMRSCATRLRAAWKSPVRNRAQSAEDGELQQHTSGKTPTRALRWSAPALSGPPGRNNCARRRLLHDRE